MPRNRILIIVGIVTISTMLAMCEVSVSKHQRAMKVADEFALNSAFDLKEVIAQQQVCPDVSPRWVDFKIDYGDRVYVAKGAAGGWFRVFYECKSDLSFYVAVYYSIDSDTFFRGSDEGNITISYGHFTERQKLIVKDRSEVVTAINSIYD